MDPLTDIVTVTLNPAIDQTVFLERLEVGQVNRTRRHHRQAGGKGVNVSSMLGQYGVPSIATGFLGRDNPQLFDELFRRLPVSDAFIRIAGETRTGIKIVEERSRETTDLNFPGLKPSAEDVRQFELSLMTLVKPGRWFVLAGSLPVGVDPGMFGEIMDRLKSGGALVAADTSGEALKLAIAGGADLVKPNVHELAEFLGRDLPDFASCCAAARDLQQTVARVILSLGEEGALFITPEAALVASAPPVQVMSTVGAGDALLAGYLAGRATSQAPDECARLAGVFAWAALEDVTRQLPDAATLRRRLSAITIRSL
ncbi:MAG: 1-phosphofructokinase [Verrucomicrobiota bacterium]